MYLCDTGIFHSVWVAVWSAVLLMMGAQMSETCREVEINILRSSVHLVGFI